MVDPLLNPAGHRLQLLILVTPLMGVLPALWLLYRKRQTHPEQLATSRLTLVLALAWVLGHTLLETGANSTESWHFSLLLISSLYTTSYFIICFGLMIRIWKRQPIWLPGISQVAEKVLGNHD